jgi:hypothetical protein
MNHGTGALKPLSPDSALVSVTCAAARRAFYSAPPRER